MIYLASSQLPAWQKKKKKNSTLQGISNLLIYRVKKLEHGINWGKNNHRDCLKKKKEIRDSTYKIEHNKKWRIRKERRKSSYMVKNHSPNLSIRFKSVFGIKHVESFLTISIHLPFYCTKSRSLYYLKLKLIQNELLTHFFNNLSF